MRKYGSNTDERRFCVCVPQGIHYLRWPFPPAGCQLTVGAGVKQGQGGVWALLWL